MGRMRYQVTGISKNPSKYTGSFYYMFFKDEQGKSIRTCLDPKMRNFKRWQTFIERVEKKEEFSLDNLKLKGNMIDADSQPKLVEEY